MLKKLSVTSFILAATSQLAFADAAPYLGISVGILDNTANTANYRGLNTTVSAGYGGILAQNFYLAGEIMLTPGQKSLDDNGLKSGAGYGISVLPGVMVSDRTLVFARLGFVRTRFNPTGLPEKTVRGDQIGLGMQTELTPNWDLRTEYSYTSYASLTGISSPKSDLFSVGVTYKFI